MDQDKDIKKCDKLDKLVEMNWKTKHTKNQESIKTLKQKKDISNCKLQNNSGQIVTKQDDSRIVSKGRDKIEVSKNVETTEFGNIKINIDDNVLQIYG